jgi:hypothetical protein
VPRTEHPTGDPDLRDYLLAEFVDFRELMSSTLEGHTIENGETVWQHLSHRIDALLDGREVTISRFQLPDWHEESPKFGGDPGDRFTLGPDDILRPYESPEPKLKLNRAERRANGWRGPGLNGQR